MIKKIISLFAALTLCISTTNCEIFAGKSELEHTLTKINDLQFRRSLDKMGRYTKQKAFLVAVLCSLGVDVQIDFRSNYTPETFSFNVVKIGDLNIYDLNRALKHRYQIPSLLSYLSTRKDIVDFKACSPKRSKGIICARINKHILPLSTIHKIGEKTLELIKKKKSEMKKNNEPLTMPKSLTEDTFFRNELINLLGDTLEKNNEETTGFKFFTLYSEFNFKGMDPIENTDHIRQIKSNSKAIHNVIMCYEKMFFTGILAAFGINTEVTLSSPESYDPVVIHKIDDISTAKIPSYSIEYMSRIINYINCLLPPEKVKIEYLNDHCMMPYKIIINNQVMLYENDILNIGQKFYNYVQESATSFTGMNMFHITIDTVENYMFKFCMNKAFKEYTNEELIELE